MLAWRAMHKSRHTGIDLRHVIDSVWSPIPTYGKEVYFDWTVWADAVWKDLADQFGLIDQVGNMFGESLHYE